MILYKILKDKGYSVSDDIVKYYNDIELWHEWWKGYVAKFHKYVVIDDTGTTSLEFKRKHLNMAKKCCEDWANLLLNDKTRIDVDGDSNSETQKFLSGDETEQNEGVLGRSHFWKNGNRAVEREFAQGTVCAILQLVNATTDGVSLNAEDIKIKFIKDARMIVPLTYDDDEIIDIAIASQFVKNKERYIYLQIYEHQDDDRYLVSNGYYQITETGEGYSQVENMNGEVESYYMPCKPFFIMTPNIENNVSDVPLGLSIYANAIDNLKGIDLAFDNMFNDTLLGKKKVFMTQSSMLMKTDVYVDEQGVKKDRIIPDVQGTLEKTLYVNVGEKIDPSAPPFMQEYNPSLRTQENKDSIQFYLNLFSNSVGLGQSRYKFDVQTMNTATEAKISMKDLTESVWKQRIQIQEVLKDMARSILIIGKEYCGANVDTEAKISIIFDDTMFNDEEAERLRFMQEISAGIKQKWEYRVKFEGEDEETARKMTGEEEGQQEDPTLADLYFNNDNSTVPEEGNTKKEENKQAKETGEEVK